MKTLLCTGFHRESYPLYLSDDQSFSDLFDYLPKSSKKFVIIDKKVVELFPEFVTKLSNNNTYVYQVEAIEKNKTWNELETVCTFIFDKQPSRDDVVVAVGGGLVINLAGLAGSLVMRGVGFYYVPTTLTGQIDASFGSKQAVNFRGAKNWIGMFNDPQWCYINPNFVYLNTERELKSQLVEGVKLALARDKSVVARMMPFLENFYQHRQEVIPQLIEPFIRMKLDILKVDLEENREGGAMLYGHTVGHAVEMLSDGKLNHGEAVGLGMLVAARLSEAMGFATSDLVAIHLMVLEKLGLPTRIPDEILISDILEKLKYNKKNYDGKIHFFLLRAVGEMYLSPTGECFANVPDEVLVKCLDMSY